jgi:hypothetical protein
MSDVRDAGIAALERGDCEAAAVLLTDACRQAPDDFAAHFGLGQARLRLSRAGDAVAAFTRAVSLAPPHPMAHRELGLALEADGKPLEAMRALQHALTLRPNDKIALDALDRLRRQIAPPRHADDQQFHRVIARQAAVDSAPAGGGYAPLGEIAYSRPPTGHAPLLDPDAAREEPTQDLAISAGHEPTASVMPPLTGPPAMEQTIPNYSFPLPATPGPAVMPYGFGALVSEDRGHDDDFSVGDAYYDLLEILTSPRDFFAAQFGREGCRAPLSMLAAYTLNLTIGLLAVLFNSGSSLGPTGMIIVLLLPFWFILLFTALTAVALGSAGLLHVACALFFRHASFSGSFRAFVYATAPIFTATALTLALSPIKPHTATLTALPYVLAILAPIWSVGLLAVALRHIHYLSIRAVVVVILTVATFCVGAGFAVNGWIVNGGW